MIVESHGEPRAVIISFDEYEKLQGLREQQRRREALDKLRQLKAEVSSRNQDLTEAQAYELADQISREAINNLAVQGEIRFERDR